MATWLANALSNSALEARMAEVVRAQRVGDALRGTAPPAQTLYERAGQMAGGGARVPPAAGPATAAPAGGSSAAQAARMGVRGVAGRAGVLAALPVLGYTAAEMVAGDENNPTWQAVKEAGRPLREALRSGNAINVATAIPGAVPRAAAAVAGSFARNAGNAALWAMGGEPRSGEGQSIAGTPTAAAATATPTYSRDSDLAKYLDNAVRTTPAQLELMARTAPKAPSAKDTLYGNAGAGITSAYMDQLAAASQLNGQARADAQAAARDQMIRQLTALLANDPYSIGIID